MSLTVFSFFMSVLFSTLFIASIHLLRNHTFFLQSFGVHTILGLYILCLFRTIVILELPFTVPIGLRNVYSTVFEAVWTTQIPVGGSKIRLVPVLCGIWAVVSTTLIVQFLWKNWKATRKAKWYSTNKAPFAEQVLEQVKKESWWTPTVSVCICPTLDMPMGIGLFRHRICLPTYEYAKRELYYILKHEYTHFCNRDLTVKFLVHLFCCIFWWNPVVYLLKKDISQILEIKCDIKATEKFSKKEKLEYLFAIVRALERADNSGRTTPPMLATGLACRKNGDDMRERFHMITAVPRSVSTLCQGAFWTLAVTLVVASYSFVLQPTFDPPVEDIYTDNSVEEFTIDGGYILQYEDGSYSLILANGTSIPINKTVLEIYLEEGLEIRKG